MTLKSLLRPAVLLAALLLTGAAQAQWYLDNEASTLSFVTIKADHVGEVHTFDRLSGAIDDEGALEITIELAAVNTLIEIRDQRMRDMLFETGIFPRATITGAIDLAAVTAMAAGTSMSMQVPIEMDIRGETNAYNTELLVTRLESGVVASTLKPILVNAGSHDMVAGVEALREVAGLPSISRAVPVIFTVVFGEED